MTSRKKQSVILITATTLGVSNISNSYVHVQAQETTQTSAQTMTNTTKAVYNANGDLLINETTFPDPYFREYVNRDLAKNAGFFTREDLLNITTIIPEDTRGNTLTNLSSVAGIEYFPNLRILKLNSTGLTTLDVSKNTLLTELDVSKTPLKVLELKDNKNIKRLDTLDTNFIYFNVNSDMQANVAIRTESNITIPSNATEIDLNELYPGIDYSKIKNVRSGKLSNGILSNYTFDYAVTITYPLIYRDFLGGVQNREFTVYLTVAYELPITDVYFPDKAFREYLLNNKDINKNGSLSTYEIHALIDINLSNHKDIKNLQGIEYLTYLETLNCSNTNIRSLDLSKNTRLRNLNTTNMSLSSIQIQTSYPYFSWAKNTSPIILDTKETYIDLAKEFPDIDISKINKNTIKNGTLEGTILHFQDTDQPMEYTYDAGSAYGNAQTLTVSIMINKEEYLKIDDTNFPDKAFQEYLLATHDTDGNGSFSQAELINIKEIDIADNKHINNLKGIEHFESLNILNCSNTDIGYLDLSNNKGLQNLNTTNTPLAWININPADPNFSWTKNDVSFVYDSKNNFIDFDQLFPGIDIAKIDKGSIKNGYLAGTKLYIQDSTLPLEYTYNAGTVNGKSFILNVSVNIIDLQYLKIDDSNFPDKAFQEYLLDNHDTDKNGYFSIEELSNVTKMDVRYSKEIKNLQGMEHFKDLIILYCSYTNIHSLDLSNNTKLRTLTSYNTPLAWIHINTTDPYFEWYKYDNISAFIDANKNYIDLAKELPGIEISKIDPDSIKHGSLQGSLLYCDDPNIPVEYTYDAGNTQTLYASIIVNDPEYLKIDDKTFPDKAFQEYLLDNHDTDKNGYFSPWELSNVTEINVNYNKEIRSLEGIKHFKNLKYLFCINTNIHSLDISNNTKLIRLISDYTPLAWIHINSTDPNFKWYKYDNIPAFIDTNENYIDLKVELPGIEISKIDPNSIKHGSLQGSLLYCDDPTIPVEYTYDAGNTQTLYASIQINKLEYLKIDDTNFPDKAFQEYLLDNHDTDKNGYFSPWELSNVTEINVNYNNAIHNLEGIAHFKDLLHLYCSYTNIHSLDLSNNTKLIRLISDYTPLAWIHINSTDPNFKWYKYDNIPAFIDTNENYIDLKVELPGIEISRIDPNSIKHGSLQGSLLYCDDPTIPVEYTYDAGNTQTLYASIQINKQEYLKIDDTNFPDKAFQEYLLDKHDTDKNGYFSSWELSNVTIINIDSNKEIKNIQGIEHFKNLIYLYCTGTNIHSLDLGDNTKLKELYTISTPLAWININTTNPDFYWGKSDVTSFKFDTRETFIDLTKEFPNIKIDKIKQDSIVNGELKGTRLYYKDPLLPVEYAYDAGTANGTTQTLYVSIMINDSKYLKIDEINFPDNTFREYLRTTYDTDKNDYFSLGELEYVKRINLDNNKDITNLQGIEYFKNLEYLNCSYTNIHSLDLGNNTKLYNLYTVGTPLAWININTTNPDFYWGKWGVTSFKFDTRETFIDLTKEFPNIKIDKIKQDSIVNGELKGTRLYYKDPLLPVEYAYDAGTANGTTQTLHVSIMINDPEYLEINDTNFPDKEFQKYLEQFDTDENGYFSNEELGKSTDIDIKGNKKIIKLEGIKYFKNLESLNCSETNITELDVSNNKKLRYLRCKNNENLNSLILSDASVLFLLDCRYTGIKTLNIQNQVNLFYLYCSHTPLKDLDLKKNGYLIELLLDYTEIKNLDLSEQKQLDYLNVAGIEIDTLNISHLSELSDLNVSETNINRLDLSKNEKLIKLDTQSTPLTWINFGTNNNNSLIWNNAPLTIQIDTTISYIDLSQYTGIDISKIKKDSIKGGTLNGTYLYFDKSGEEVSYTYDAGVVGGASQELTVTFIANEIGIKVNDINFPDSAFLDYIKNKIDTNGSGILTTDEIEAATSIEVNNMGISDLTGIENLTSLEKLDCGDNPDLTSLDLHSNKNLEELIIEGTNLTDLNLGDNDKVKVNHGQSEITSSHTVDVNGPSFDITAVLPNIDVDRIISLDGADLDGNIISGYQLDVPITYSYKTNDSENNPFTLIVTLELTINPIDRTITFQKDFDKNKVYDGTEISISSNDIDMPGDKTLLSYTWQKLVDKSWVDMSEAPVHAGTYQVTAHAATDGFYKEVSSQPKEVIISQAQNEWTIMPAITGWTYGEYDANKHAPIAAAKFGQRDVTYKDAQGTIRTTTPQDAGAWTMIVNVPETEDYTGISKEVPFTIKKAAAPALKLPENLSAVHSDTLSSIVLPNGWTWANGQEKVSVHKLSYTARFAVDDKNYDYSTVLGYDANGHYVEREIVVQVSQMNNSWTEMPKINDWTYGEAAVDPTYKAAYGDVEVTYSDSKNGNFVKDVPTQAGNWFVKLQVPATNEYTGLEVILPFTIKQAAAPALVLPKNLSAVHGDILSNIVLPTGWTWVNGQEKVSVYKLSYTARFAVDDKNYDYTNVSGYHANGHYVEIQLPVTISEHTNQWVDTPSIENWTYGEKTMQPAGTAAYGNVDVTYSDKVDGIFTKDVPTEAGNWFVKLQVSASAEYTGLEAVLPFTIYQAVAPALKLPENLSAVHDDTLSNIVLPTGWTWVNGQEKVSIHKTSYTARFAVDDKNYDYSNVAGYDANGHYVEIQLSVTISEYANQWIDMPSIENWTYGETAVNPTGKAAHGDIVVTYSNAVDGIFTKDVPTEAGNWFVKVQVPASAEYTGLEAILPFTIHKAQAPALILPENLSAVHGDTLSSISLPTGWNWVNGQEKVSVHKAGYMARFVVDDKNYDYSNVSGYDAKGHYVEVAIQLHVSQANNTWTTTPSIANWTYGEAPAQPIGQTAYGDVEVTYSDAMDGTFTKDVPSEAGNWFVKFLVPASAEYAGMEAILPFTIHQAQAPALILPDNLSALHGDALSSIKLPNGWYWVDAQGSVSGNVKTYLARCSVDDKNYDYTAVPGYNASGHYVEVELTILIAQQSNQWIEKPSIADWMYGETPAQPSGKAEHGDVVFTYSDTMDGTYVSEQPTKPGTWYMKARVTANEAYLGLEEIVTFEILPKEDIVKDTDVAQASGLWTILLASIAGLLSCTTRKKQRNKK